MIETLPPTAADRPPLTDRQLQRMQYRIGLFQRRGMTEACAEAWACRLVERDADRDDRRLCFECSNLQHGGRCAVKLPKKRPDEQQSFQQPIHFVLQRCATFKFQTP